jgi:hypothetical protein
MPPIIARQTRGTYAPCPRPMRSKVALIAVIAFAGRRRVRLLALACPCQSAARGLHPDRQGAPWVLHQQVAQLLHRGVVDHVAPRQSVRLGCRWGPAAHALWPGLLLPALGLLLVVFPCQFGHLAIEFPCFMRSLPLLKLGRLQPVQGFRASPSAGDFITPGRPTISPHRLGTTCQSSRAWAATTARAPIRPDKRHQRPQPESPGGTACAVGNVHHPAAQRLGQQLGIEGERGQGVGQGHGIRPCIRHRPSGECRGLRTGAADSIARLHRVQPRPTGAGR